MRRFLPGKYLRYAVIAGVAVYSLYVLHLLSRDKVNAQRDFQVYYYAARAQAAGLNPYNIDSLTEVEPSIDRTRPYVYLPCALVFFKPFAALPYAKAFGVFLVLQTLFIAAFVFIWVRGFLKEEADALFYLFCLLGFNNALFVGIANGNITILEQLLIWISFIFFVRKKLFLFCLFIMLAASFKLSPIVLLALLLFSDDENRHIYLLTALIVFFGFHALSFALVRDSFGYFCANGFDSLKEPGLINPSTLIFFSQLRQLALTQKGVDLSSWIPWTAYFTVAAAVIFVTFKALAKWRRSAPADKETVAVYFASVAYALIAPRMKDYSYMILIVPAWYIFRRMNGIRPYILLFILAVFTIRTESLPYFNLAFFIAWNYNPLILAYVIWGFYLYQMNNVVVKPIAKEG